MPHGYPGTTERPCRKTEGAYEAMPRVPWQCETGSRALVIRIRMASTSDPQCEMVGFASWQMPGELLSRIIKFPRVQSSSAGFKFAKQVHRDKYGETYRM